MYKIEKVQKEKQNTIYVNDNQLSIFILCVSIISICIRNRYYREKSKYRSPRRKKGKRRENGRVNRINDNTML